MAAASGGDGNSEAADTIRTFERADNHDALAEARRILAAAEKSSFRAQALGGVGVALRCCCARSPAPLARGYSDVDLITIRSDAKGFAALLGDLGYQGDEEFNALFGSTRLSFDHEEHGHLDIFVGAFEMCHRLDLRGRIGISGEALTPADLLLTKLQVAELTEKDTQDVAAVLLELNLTADDQQINVPYINDLLGSDWGWWRTVTGNLGIVAEHAPHLPVDASSAVRIRSQVGSLLTEIETAPKSLKWRMRARFGERKQWYEVPDESRQ
jgi:hypothetical protein